MVGSTGKVFGTVLLILMLFDFLLSMLITWVGTVRVKTSDKQERVPES